MAHTQGRRHRSTAAVVVVATWACPQGLAGGGGGEDSEVWLWPSRWAMFQEVSPYRGLAGEDPPAAPTGVGSREGRQVPGEVGPDSAPHTARTATCPLLYREGDPVLPGPCQAGSHGNKKL